MITVVFVKAICFFAILMKQSMIELYVGESLWNNLFINSFIEV